MKLSEFDENGRLKRDLFVHQINEHLDDGSIKSIRYYQGSDVLQHVQYTKSGFYHRIDGPAIIMYDTYENIVYEEYRIMGTTHREDEPAVIYYSSIGSLNSPPRYFLNGEEYDDKDIIENWKEFCKLQLYK